MIVHIVKGNQDTAYHTFTFSDTGVSAGEYWRNGEKLAELLEPSVLKIPAGRFEIWLLPDQFMVREANPDNPPENAIDRLAWRFDDDDYHVLHMEEL